LGVFLNMGFHGETLPPRPTPKLEDHPLSAAHDCFFKLFAATLRFDFFSISVKMQGDSYNFDIAESEYGNKTALSPTNIKGRD